MWFAEPILLAIGQEPVVAALAQDYLRIAGFGMLPVLRLTLNSYLAAMERTQIVLWVTLAGLPVNVFLNWVLIFGNLGAPELGGARCGDRLGHGAEPAAGAGRLCGMVAGGANTTCSSVSGAPTGPS